MLWQAMRFRLRVYTLLAFAVLAGSGCANRERALRSTNVVSRTIEGATAGQISAAAERAFAKQGFQPAPGTVPQELKLAKAPPPPVRFIKGGDAVVWLVLQPRGKGWEIYCVTEPSGLHPGGTAARFSPLLDGISSELARPAARGS